MTRLLIGMCAPPANVICIRWFALFVLGGSRYLYWVVRVICIRWFALFVLGGSRYLY